MVEESFFRSFFLGGFECASHRRSDGKRLDLLKSTNHDRFAGGDYRQLRDHGIRTVRDGLRWHRIERVPRYYDWTSFLPMLQAAAAADTSVIWDLCHYGVPDHLDIWSASFVDHFRNFSAAAAQLVKDETGKPGTYCPINEMSFWAWAGGDVGRMTPLAKGRGYELKVQLARAAIAAIDAIRHVDPAARFITAEPLINVAPGADHPTAICDAEDYRLSQFQATDMLAGKMEKGLGGKSDFLDIIGLNYYPENQWYLGGPTIPFGHHSYRPLSSMLREAFARYERPLLISETGAESSAAAAWLYYVCSEVRVAHALGVPVEGICLYPIADYPGWENDRMCEVGLLGAATEGGTRAVNSALSSSMKYFNELFTKRGNLAHV